MSKDMMPERWEIPLSCDYRSAANGDWVRAEDVEPLVAEITRLRANGCARNQGLTLHCGEAVLARDEITRLRARVEVLREPLAVYVHAHQTGNSVPPHIEAAARAALEAKP